MPRAGEVIDAAVDRLAAWTEERVAAGIAGVVGLLAQGVPVDGAHPLVAALLERLQDPGDRRDPWGALMALLVLVADARSDAGLFWRAGAELLRCAAQALRARQPRSRDPLDELLIEFLTRHPAADTAAIWEHCAALARTGVVVEDADADSLTFWSRDALRTVSRNAFAIRVSRARKKSQRQAFQQPAPENLAAHAA